MNFPPTSQPLSGTSTGSTSPNELANTGSVKSPFGSQNVIGSSGGSLGSARMGAGSPSHDLGARLYSKR